MIAPKFIRFQKVILNVHDIANVWYNDYDEGTHIGFIHRSHNFKFDGDVLDELWGLIKFALASKDESYPSDTTHLEQRIKGIEEKVTLIVDHLDSEHVEKVKIATAYQLAAGHRKLANMGDLTC